MLPTLPFHVLRALFSSTPLTTDDGVLLRRMALEIGAIHLILACLSALSHHAPRNSNTNANVSEVWNSDTERKLGSSSQMSLIRGVAAVVAETPSCCLSVTRSGFQMLSGRKAEGCRRVRYARIEIYISSLGRNELTE